MASPLSNIEKSLDDYQFAMTVEWDQKDQNFYQQKTEKFYKEIQLAISEGLTKEEIFKLAEKRMKSKQAVDALKLKMSLLNFSAATPLQLADILKSSSSEFYTQGASWNGDFEEIALWAGIAIFVGLAIWFVATYECVDSERYYDCDWVEDSDGDKYKDCGYETRCLEYVKR